MLEIKEFQRRDYRAAIVYAIEGMHFDWYINNRFFVYLYGKYFLLSELDKATSILAAYDGNRFAGVLVSRIYGESRIHHSFRERLYIKIFEIGAHIYAGKSAYTYDECCARLYQRYQENNHEDGWMIMMAVDTKLRGKGVGTFLIDELGKRYPGKRLILNTDSACTYQFYDRRGFSRKETETIEIDIKGQKTIIDCYIYEKTF